jgi:hypothetical protein
MGDESTTAQQYYERILDGIGMLTTPIMQILDQSRIERDEARESEWRILNGWGGTPEIIHDFIKGQQTRIHHAQDLEEELATITAQRDRLAKSNLGLATELTAITAQRDRLAKSNLGLATELTAITAQRDRLAVALREIGKGITEPTHHRRGTLEIANEALAAVKGEEQ